MGEHSGSGVLLFFFALFLLFLTPTNSQPSPLVEDLRSTYSVDQSRPTWNYTYIGASQKNPHSFWIFVCSKYPLDSYSCSPTSTCQTNQPDPDGNPDLTGVEWTGDSVTITLLNDQTISSNHLTEQTYYKDSSSQSNPLIKIDGPGCLDPILFQSESQTFLFSPSPSPSPSPSEGRFLWWQILIITVGCLLVVFLIGSTFYLLNDQEKRQRGEEGYYPLAVNN